MPEIMQLVAEPGPHRAGGLRFDQRGQEESDETWVEDLVKQDLKGTMLRAKSWESWAWTLQEVEVFGDVPLIFGWETKCNSLLPWEQSALVGRLLP